MNAPESLSLKVLSEPTSSKESSVSTGRSTLPPLTPQFPKWSRGKLELEVFHSPSNMDSEEGAVVHMLNNYMVNKKAPELGGLGRMEGPAVSASAPSDPLLRITYLEQNIRFLQEQHQAMLSSLHQEVEQLKQRNRDLQFQLVFSKGSVTPVQSNSNSPSSPEDDSKPKVILSPKQANTTPLQVEILEKEVAELKNTLEDFKMKNLFLSKCIDQHTKAEAAEKNRRDLETSSTKVLQDAQNQVNDGGSTIRKAEDMKTEPTAEELELTLKLDEAEKLIRRLRRENDDQRRELVTIKANLSKTLNNSGVNSRPVGQVGGGNSHRGGGVNHHRPHNQQSQRFPPLHTQSYWHHGQNGGQQHRGGRGNFPASSMEFVSNRHCPNGGNRLEKDAQVVGRPVPSLPNLRSNSTGGYSYGGAGNANNGHRRGGHYNNGNHYYRSGKDEGSDGRKYRGGGGRGARDSKP